MRNKYLKLFLVGLIVPVLITILGVIVASLGNYYINEVACKVTDYERMCGFAPSLIILFPASLLLAPSAVFLRLFGIQAHSVSEISSILSILVGGGGIGFIFGTLLVVVQKIFHDESRKPRRKSR
jgi:hypothetical protein